MIIDANDLKYDGQCPKLMYTLVILIIFFEHLVFLTITLRCFHKTLLKSKVNKLLHLSMALVNFLFEKEGYIDDSFDGSSSKILMLI